MSAYPLSTSPCVVGLSARLKKGARDSPRHARALPRTDEEVTPTEVPRVLFLGVCLDFYYCLRRVLVPKFGFHFSWRAVAQALVKPRLVPP